VSADPRLHPRPVRRTGCNIFESFYVYPPRTANFRDPTHPLPSHKPDAISVFPDKFVRQVGKIIDRIPTIRTMYIL